MFNGFRIDVYGAKSSCTVLISGMNIEKGKAQKIKTRRLKMKFSRISRMHAQDLITLGKIIKRFHSIIARHINYNFRNWAFLCFFLPVFKHVIKINSL